MCLIIENDITGIHASGRDYSGARVIQGPELFFYINPSFKNNIDSFQEWWPCYASHLTLSCHLRKCPPPLNITTLRTKFPAHELRDHTQNNANHGGTHPWSKRLILIFLGTPSLPLSSLLLLFLVYVPGNGTRGLGNDKWALYHWASVEPRCSWSLPVGWGRQWVSPAYYVLGSDPLHYLWLCGSLSPKRTWKSHRVRTQRMVR